MSTRAASAANSRRAKQEIVRLLFGPKYSRKGPEAHRKLDPFQYSYADLRSAYLERLHDLHPDKSAHMAAPKSSQKDELHQKFVELQDAWDKYETVVRMLKNVSGGDKEEANFTMFGVGCSFSDSPEEQKRRAEITDQACRGWFSGGEIAEKSITPSQTETKSREQSISLVDDDWFISTEEYGGEESSKDRHVQQQQSSRQTSPRRSLVDMHFRSRNK